MALYRVSDISQKRIFPLLFELSIDARQLLKQTPRFY